MASKTKITLEKIKRTRIFLRRRQLTIWCRECEAEVLMLSPETAAVLSKTNVRQIYRQIEIGEVHFIETVGGETLICQNSLKS